MTTERIETLIIGGGQAGLSTGYHLKQRGRTSVIIDALGRLGDNWRRHYDSLQLYSPAKLNGLPGTVFPGPAMSLPTKDEVADYLESYAAEHGLEVRTGVRATRVQPERDAFHVETSNGTIQADNVVVASGTFGKPFVPAFADGLDASIVQLHSSEYKNPGQLQDGAVLVVGAAHSGADIAVELASTRPTILSGRRTGDLPFHLDGALVKFARPLLRFAVTKVVSTRTPVGRKAKGEIRSHGGPLIDPRTKDVEAAGVEWVEVRTEGVREGKPVLADGRVLDVTNVVWCTGFRHDFSWIDADIVGDDGWPVEDRGVVESLPGLYFMGLAFQSAFSSMLLLGVGDDADHVASHISSRMVKRAASLVA